MDYQIGLQKVNGIDLFSWFVSGAKEVADHANYLNDINVFPVRDGDTGTNLCVTLRAMVERPAQKQSFACMMEDISKSGLESARGNSGILFATYFSGIAIESQPYESVDVKEFSSIAFHAVKHLYAAVEHPLEGTLISIIRDWAMFLESNKDKSTEFRDLFSSAYRFAAVSLEKTKYQLDILRRYNVVDSGAAGFVSFLKGINRTFTHKQADDKEHLLNIIPAAVKDEFKTFRYCTEALIDTSVKIGQQDVIMQDDEKATLSGFGDSLIVTCRENRIKVHIHTDFPERVMDFLKRYGSIIEQKADDMAMQNCLHTTQKGGIGILTDSVADIPNDYKLSHRIFTIPMGVIIDGCAYLDKITIKLEQLFERMKQNGAYPSSSQPEPARIQEMISSLLDHFDSLIILSVSGRLSGTHQAFTHAAQKIAQDKRVTVIDTKLNSGAQGLLVKAAAELISDGLSHEQVVERIENMIPRTKIYVCLNTLAYAVQGGRVPNTIGRLGMKLGLRPIMTLDKHGNGSAFGVSFSQAGLTRQILRIVRRTMSHSGIESFSIVHGDNLPLALEYAAQLTKITGIEPAFISEISSAVALHAGPGTVAVCLTQRDEGTT